MIPESTREEQDLYEQLQADLNRYSEVLDQIRSIEQDNGTWAAGELAAEAQSHAAHRLEQLYREKRSLETLCAGHINPPTP